MLYTKCSIVQVYVTAETRQVYVCYNREYACYNKVHSPVPENRMRRIVAAGPCVRLLCLGVRVRAQPRSRASNVFNGSHTTTCWWQWNDARGE